VAKVVDSVVDSEQISVLFPYWRILLVGVVSGISYWGFTIFILNYIGKINVAGNISTILVATICTVIMLNFRMARPLLVALASAVSLWGLVRLTNGLEWFEVVSWDILLYVLSLLLFCWITRYKRILPVLVAIIVIVAIVRLTITL